MRRTIICRIACPERRIEKLLSRPPHLRTTTPRIPLPRRTPGTAWNKADAVQFGSPRPLPDIRCRRCGTPHEADDPCVEGD